MKYLAPEAGRPAHTGYQQQVKEANIKQIFDLVRGGKCSSRAEIVRHMKLSATSVSVLVEELATRGLIDETGPAQSTLPGRRPISLRLNSDAHQMAVFTLSTQQVRYTLLNLDCQVVESLCFPQDSGILTAANAGETYAALFEDILRHRAKRFDSRKALMVGVSFPGIYIARDRQFYTAPTMGFSLEETDMRAFQRRIGLPVYLLNGTRSMAYAEKKYLDAVNPDGEETRDILFVTVHDNVRSSIVSHGDIFSGPYNVSGEIGHVTIDQNGRPCYCGSRGCLERYVNLQAILEDARQAAEASGVTPPESLEALARRYPNEPELLGVVESSARTLAAGLYGVLCGTGMRRVVLGGGIEILGNLFLQEVRDALCARTLLIRSLNLSYAQAGPDAEAVGIAHHYLDKVYTVTM